MARVLVDIRRQPLEVGMQVAFIRVGDSTRFYFGVIRTVGDTYCSILVDDEDGIEQVPGFRIVRL